MEVSYTNELIINMDDGVQYLYDPTINCCDKSAKTASKMVSVCESDVEITPVYEIMDEESNDFVKEIETIDIEDTDN